MASTSPYIVTHSVPECLLFVYRSPVGSPHRSRSPAFADSTFSAVQAALNKRQLQVSELKSRLASARETAEYLGRDIGEKEAKIRQLEGSLMEYKEVVDTA